jgi:uncharacterized protein (DUF433 family)
MEQAQLKDKRKISARELLTDVRAGLNDSNLMEKYQLDKEGLQYLLRRLVDSGQ